MIKAYINKLIDKRLSVFQKQFDDDVLRLGKHITDETRSSGQNLQKYIDDQLVELNEVVKLNDKKMQVFIDHYKGAMDENRRHTKVVEGWLKIFMKDRGVDVDKT